MVRRNRVSGVAGGGGAEREVCFLLTPFDETNTVVADVPYSVIGNGSDTLCTSSSMLENRSADSSAVARGLGIRSVGEPPVPHLGLPGAWAVAVVAVAEEGSALEEVVVVTAPALGGLSAASMTMALAPELPILETVNFR